MSHMASQATDMIIVDHLEWGVVNGRGLYMYNIITAYSMHYDIVVN